MISYYPENAESGMAAFLSSIPMNLYAVLTLFMVFWMALKKNSEYGPMAKAELQAATTGELGAIDSSEAEDEFNKVTKKDSNGRVSDLVIPIVVLIVLSILSMLFVGGSWDGTGKSLFDAFGDTDTGYALALSAFMTLSVTFIYYLLRRVLNFKEYFGCINQGVKSMVPACVILPRVWGVDKILDKTAA